MIRNFFTIFECTGLVFTYARKPCILTILQKFLAAAVMPLGIYATQQVIGTALLVIGGGEAAALGSQMAALVPWLALLFCAFAIQEGTAYFNAVITIKLKHDLDRRFAPVIAGKFSRLEYRRFEDSGTADILNRMGGEPHYTALDIYQRSLDCVSQILGIAGTSLIIARVSPLFSVIFLVFVLVQALLSSMSMKAMNTMFTSQSSKERELGYLGGLLEEKSPVFELKLFNAVNYILDKWKKINTAVLNERVWTTVKAQRYYGASCFLLIAWTVFVFVSLVNSLAAGHIGIDFFIAVIMALNTIVSQGDELSYNLSEALRKLPVIEAYNAFMALPEDAGADDPAISDKLGDPEIEFRNVSFTYPGTQTAVLRNLSFTIGRKRRIALAGENGAGKSTIIKLLLKLYRPNAGEILINGISLSRISRNQLKNVFSVVFQDFAFYSLTLRENVAFGGIEKLRRDAELRRALETGMAGDLALLRPKGLETNLGKIEDDGIDLSGGQKQRLAISRSCAGDGAFIILDEPAAAMDPSAESALYETFSQLIKNRGCVMISHRMASARLADDIIVIHQGAVYESGGHRELMEKNGLYAEMYRKQAEWFEERKEEREERA